MQRMSRTAHVPQLTTMGHISDTRERNSIANHCSVSRFLSPLVMFVIHVAVFLLKVCLRVSLRQFCVRVREAASDATGFVNASRFTTASQRQEGQQLPLGTICHRDVPLWPFQRGRLECLCVGKPQFGTHVAPPCFRSGRRNARAKRGSANNTTNHCQKHYQGVGQAVQRSALVRRKHPSVERSREPPDIFGRFLFVASRNAATCSP